MKTKNRTRKLNKPIIIIASILLAGALAASTYAFVLKPANDAPTEPTQSETESPDNQQSEEPEAAPNDKETGTHTDTPPAPTTNGESDKKQVQMVASVDQSNNTVYIRGGVNYPVSGGSCYVKLSGPSGQTVQKDSVVLPNPASTDCKTIIISDDELAPGKWTFTLNYTSDEYEGTSVEISFTI